MKGWYLITHNLHGFQLVTSKIGLLAVEIYSPTLIEFTPRRDCRGVRKAEKQLFPGYLFLRFDPELVHTTTISDVPGVKGFVRFGDQIGMVSDQVIEGLKRSTQISFDRPIRNVECANVSQETLESISAIVKMRSRADREVAFFALLEKDSTLVSRSKLRTA